MKSAFTSDHAVPREYIKNSSGSIITTRIQCRWERSPSKKYNPLVQERNLATSRRDWTIISATNSNSNKISQPQGKLFKCFLFFPRYQPLQKKCRLCQKSTSCDKNAINISTPSRSYRNASTSINRLTRMAIISWKHIKSNSRKDGNGYDSSKRN